MKALKNWISYQRFTLLGGVVGAITGYIIHLNYSCTTNMCVIASPYKAVFFIGAMGAILGSYFHPKQITTTPSNEHEK